MSDETEHLARSEAVAHVRTEAESIRARVLMLYPQTRRETALKRWSAVLVKLAELEGALIEYAFAEGDRSAPSYDGRAHPPLGK